MSDTFPKKNFFAICLFTYLLHTIQIDWEAYNRMLTKKWWNMYFFTKIAISMQKVKKAP